MPTAHQLSYFRRGGPSVRSPHCESSHRAVRFHRVMAVASELVIRVSAVVLRDDAGQILTVRKRGTSRFMLPGGKYEPDETAEQTAIRECAEEVGIKLDPGGLRRLGVFRAEAANEPGHQVESTVFEHPPMDSVAPAGEIDEVRWLDPSRRPLPPDLAPMLEHHVIPALGH